MNTNIAIHISGKTEIKSNMLCVHGEVVPTVTLLGNYGQVDLFFQGTNKLHELKKTLEAVLAKCNSDINP